MENGVSLRQVPNFLNYKQKCTHQIQTHFIHETPILETDSAKYLGIVIDTK